MKNLLDKDSVLKIGSVLSAVLLWFLVLNIQNPQMDKEIRDVPVKVPFEVLNDEGMVRRGNEEYTVTVSVKGRIENIRNIVKSSFSAYLDLKVPVSTGKITVPVIVALYPEVPEMEIIDQSPKTITMDIDRLVRVKKEIQVVLPQMNEKDAYYVVRSVKPDFVTISGPASIVENIGAAKAIISDAGDGEKPSTHDVRYRLFTKNNDDITDNRELERKDVSQVEVELAPMKSREVPVNPVIDGAPAGSHAVVDIGVAPERIYITGTPEGIAGVTGLITVPISIDGLTSNCSEKAELVLPSGVSVLEGDGTVTVNVGIEKEGKKSVSITDFKIIGAKEEFSYEILNNKVDITFRGLQRDLDAVSRENVEGYIDVKELIEGQTSVPVIINVPPEVNLEGGPYEVEVKTVKKAEDEAEQDGS